LNAAVGAVLTPYLNSIPAEQTAYVNSIAGAELIRSTATGDALVTLADARGAAGVAYAGAINLAEAGLAATELAQLLVLETQSADAEKDRVIQIAAIDRQQVVDAAAALVDLHNDQRVAGVTHDTALATAAANYQQSVSADQAAWAQTLSDPAKPRTVYQAAYAQAQANWIADVVPAYVSHATASAQADFSLPHNLAIAKAAETNDKAVADEAFLTTEAAKRRDLIVGSVTQSNQDFLTLQPHQHTRRLATAQNTRDYEHDVAAAHRQHGIDVSTVQQAREQNAIDQFGAPTIDPANSADFAAANLTLATSLADARLGWQVVETAAQSVYSTDAITLQHTHDVYLATANHGYEIDLAIADQIRDDLHAVAEGDYLQAEVAAQNARRTGHSAANAALWNSEQGARVDAAVDIDGVLQSDWSEYLVDAAAAQQAWWSSATTDYSNLTLDRNAAEVTYATRLETAHLLREQTYAAAEKTRADRIADAKRDMLITRAASLRDFYNALTLPSVTYSGDLAQTQRDHAV
ncbi:MAG: hypothetical protein MI861_20275, partial [Pirellulales bacterium]|nr:hypothetical protein [Pirellulales bacterium]